MDLRGEDSGRSGTSVVRRVWLWALLLGLAAACGILWMTIGRTGGSLRVALHASRKGDDGAPNAPPRFVAELPGPEGRVDSRDYLQLSYAGLRSPAYATVVAIDDSGAEHPYVPRPDAEPLRVGPTRQPRELGPSVYLGRQRPGRFRLFAVFSETPLDARAIREAAARAAARGQLQSLDGIAGLVVAGSLVIEP
jgi:hypothetical protein